jgi:hypothetical protein
MDKPPRAKCRSVISAFGCRGRVVVRAEAAAPIREAAAEAGAAFLARATSGNIALPTFLMVSVTTEPGRPVIDAVFTWTRVGQRISIKIPTEVDLPELRHVLAHELGHVLIGGVLGQDLTSKGPYSEYVAERLGWEIGALAGWRPGIDQAIQNLRPNQLHWLPELVKLARTDRHRHGEAIEDVALLPRIERRWWIRAADSFIKPEAYALGTEHALGIELEPVELPAVVRADFAHILDPVIHESDRLPRGADGPTLEEFVVLVGSGVQQRYSKWSRQLPGQTLTHADEFLRLAPTV